MALKDILVHLDATERAGARLRLATELARQHDAHLIALHVIDLTLPAIVASEPSGGVMLAELLEDMRRIALADAARVEAAFRERVRTAGIQGEWRLVEGSTPGQVALNARYADLTVLGQADPAGGVDSPGNAAAVVEEVLFTSGRPVLLVPFAGHFEAVGKRVLIGWNASREAARAVNDALPLLAQAELVMVLAVNPRRGLGGHGDQPGADIALHLARHGVRVEVQHAVAPEIGEADVLLNTAADKGADLLVMGAYGHSRLRELVLGGVTRSLLRQMTIPLLMAH